MDSVLLPSEIDIFIDTMTPQKMKDVATPQWLDWHQRLQRLNQEALVEASALKEEHVKETLVTYDKVKVLIHEAILISIWKQKILPQLFKLEPSPESTFIGYTILYHEAVCVALLELVLYHPSCCETLEEYAADLVDYAYGTASQLLSIKQTEPEPQENSEKELLRQKNNLSFDIGIRSLAVIRYLTENLERLPFSITSQVYTTFDIPVLFTEILCVAPWIKDGKIYSGGTWKVWDNEQLGQAEAQVWLTLRQLLLDPECPKRYNLTDSRRNQLTKLLPLMKPTLLDQLSPLIELNHWLHRVGLMEQSAPSTGPLLLEMVLGLKDNILKECGGKWKKLAQKQLPLVFNNDKEALQEVAKKLSVAYNTDLLEKLEVKDRATCAQCGKGAIQRCSKCKKSWYCSRACQVTHWPQHREECKC
nr:unnamed protein product [Callosobruchus chinensis]